MRWATLVVAVLSAACVKPGAVVCGDGRICPDGTTCDNERELCLTDPQVHVCGDQSIPNGDVCDADGLKGICDRGFCEPGCGDGTTDPNEQCDDGNFGSHDGCSSRCEVEIPTWVPFTPTWHGLSSQSAAFHPGIGTGRTIMVGGFNLEGVSDRIWQHDPVRFDLPERGWYDITDFIPAAERPPARVNGAMAYDPIRNVVVFAGGAVANTSDPADYVTDIWEYTVGSGTSMGGELIGKWVKAPASVPARLYPTMAFDGNLGKIVYLGGSDPTAGGANSPKMFTYDGTSVVEINPPGRPPQRSRAGLAFDDTRDVLVYYGGGTGLDENVYEFDGAQWTAIAGTGPGGRRTPGLAYDATRGTVVLYGGTLADSIDTGSDSWEWNGTLWTPIVTSLSPPGRRAMSLITEAGGLLLVGGAQLQGEPYADSWRFEAGQWANQTPRFGPGFEADSIGAYSPLAGGVLVAGGQDTLNAQLSESWVFTGTRWRYVANLIEARSGNCTVYDPDHQRFITLHGAPPNGDPILTTMETLAGNAITPMTANPMWSPLTVSGTPPLGRYDGTAAYDESHHRLVVFGGATDATTFPTETLTFDGTAWGQITGDHPKAGFGVQVAYDGASGTVIAFDADGHTWQLGDTAWTKLIPADSTTPRGREVAGFTYDRFRKKLVLGGGELPGQGAALDDVWELDVPTATWTRLFVAGTGPLPRIDLLAFTYHENARGVVLHGGRAGSLITQGDTWMLKYLSNTLDEDCTDGTDTDGDAQIDIEDPDCNPQPPSD